MKYILQRDGNAWCATEETFVNLQESPAGFGDTPSEAISNLQDEVIEKLMSEIGKLQSGPS